MNYPTISSLNPGSNLVTNEDESLILEVCLNPTKKSILILCREESTVSPTLYTLSSLWKYLPSEFKTMPGDASVHYEGKSARVGIIRELHVVSPRYYLPNGIITDYKEEVYTLSSKLEKGEPYYYATWLLKYFGPGEDEFTIYATTKTPENYRPRENPLGYEKIDGEYIPKLK